MRILLVAATTFEVDFFLRTNQNIEVLITGVGVPVTMYHITRKLQQHSYHLVLQAGIAGSFSERVKMGEVVLVKQDAFGDVGVEEKETFKTVFQLGFADQNTFPFSHGWLVNDHRLLQTASLKAVKGITVNKLSDRKEQTLQMQTIFNADIESMEGAALHYVCMQMNIPYLQMRSISNAVGERDKSKWDLKAAIENLNIQINNVIQILT